MKKLLPFTLILIVGLMLAACASSRSAPDYGMSGGAGASQPMEAPAAPAMDMAYSEEAPAQAVANSGGAPATSIERMVLKNAQISIVVADVEGRVTNIQVMAQQMGGYVVSSNMYQSYASDNVYVPEAQLVIRVPADRLDKALEEIKKDVVEVKSETSSGEDVTAQYVDLQSRLKNLEAAEAQLEEIMKQATETEDVINVFNQLTAYREQIELVKGQMKYYEESAALSVITVQIIAEEKEQPIQIGGWQPSGVARESIQNLIYFFQGFVDFLIRFILLILPVLILISIPFYLAFLALRAIFRWLRGPKKKEQPQENVEKK
jgi:hypothetical protein